MMPMSYFEGKGEEIIIKAPSSNYDYLGFTYNGKHACEDLGIYRVSSSNRYQEELNPERREQTAEAPGADYTYYLGETFGPRKFKVDFAFEGRTQTQINAIRDCFDDMDIHELWFDEYPYKVYEAKVQGAVTLKVIPFGNNNEEPTYSGEGSVTFVCYTPYARTPDWVEVNGVKLDGKNIYSYTTFANFNQWREISRLDSNVGQVPFHFNAILKDTNPLNIQNTVTHNNLTYMFNEKANGYYCVACNANNINDVTIPEIVNGFPIVGIKGGVFDNVVGDFTENVIIDRWLIKIVSLNSDMSSENIIGIADNSLTRNCLGQVLYLPKSLKYIGYQSFCYRLDGQTYSLQELYINDDIAFISEAAFEFNRNLDKICFYHVENDKKIVATSSKNCRYKIDNEYLIDTITKTIIQGTRDTDNNKNPKATKLSQIGGIQRIGDGAFHGLSFFGKDMELNLPQTLVSVGDYAFRTNYCLKINIPPNVKSLGEYSFAVGQRIIEIKFLGKALNTIGTSAFASCGVTRMDPFTRHPVKFNFSKLEHLNSIGEKAFYNVAFDGDLDLSSLEQLIYIDKQAFYRASFDRLILPQNLQKIEKQCFAVFKQSDVSSGIRIPKSVESLSRSAFHSPSMTNKIHFDFETTKAEWYYYKNKNKIYVTTELDNNSLLNAESFWSSSDNFYCTNNLEGPTIYCEMESGEKIQKKIKLLETDIDEYTKITWNSATGLVIGEKGGVKKALHIQGDSAVELPPGIIDTINIQDLQYHYWYY